MANQLKMALIETILTLQRRGWSQRRIARELDIDRETVGRYLRMAESASKPAIALAGSAADESPSKPAIAPPGSEGVEPASALPGEAALISLGGGHPTLVAPSSRRGRSSTCESWRAIIRAKLDQ
jgi:transcriptional regulator with XRE-family HTH domain